MNFIKRNIFDILMIVIGVALGIMNIFVCEDIDAFSYGCILFLYLLRVVEDIICRERNNKK